MNYKTVGHHTLMKTTESVSQRQKLGPVLSSVNQKSSRNKPFVGVGYYFWENNLEAAEWWGEKRYLSNGHSCRIFRMDFELNYDDNLFFDMVGNINHLKALKRMIDKVKINVIDSYNWKLNNFIAYFKDLNESGNINTFPYQIIRFADHSTFRLGSSSIQLTDNQNFTNISPFYIICVLNKELLNLGSFIYIKELTS